MNLYRHILLLTFGSLFVLGGTQPTTRRALVHQALMNHTRCDVLRKYAQKTSVSISKRHHLKKLARLSCCKAAQLYQRYLKLFPSSDKRYEFTWYLGDSLYTCQRYKKAANVFKSVRDWPNQSEYRVEAAYSLIDSLVQLLKHECKNGRITKSCEGTLVFKAPKHRSKSSRTRIRKRLITPLPIPQLQRQIILARRVFLKWVAARNDPRDPEQLYLLARMYQAYLHQPEAQRLLWKFVKQYPRHNLAQHAAKLLINIHYTRGDWKTMYKVQKKLHQLGVLRSLPGCIWSKHE